MRFFAQYILRSALDSLASLLTWAVVRAVSLRAVYGVIVAVLLLGWAIGATRAPESREPARASPPHTPPAAPPSVVWH